MEITGENYTIKVRPDINTPELTVKDRVESVFVSRKSELREMARSLESLGMSHELVDSVYSIILMTDKVSQACQESSNVKQGFDQKFGIDEDGLVWRKGVGVGNEPLMTRSPKALLENFKKVFGKWCG